SRSGCEPSLRRPGDLECRGRRDADRGRRKPDPEGAAGLRSLLLPRGGQRGGRPAPRGIARVRAAVEAPNACEAAGGATLLFTGAGRPGEENLAAGAAAGPQAFPDFLSRLTSRNAHRWRSENFGRLWITPFKLRQAEREPFQPPSASFGVRGVLARAL